MHLLWDNTHILTIININDVKLTLNWPINLKVSTMRLKNFSLSFGMPLFRSLADESRVRILHILMERKELCITDLEHILDFTQTKTSRHLVYLKNSGLVNTRKQDQWVFYSIREEVYDFISQVLSFVKKDPQLINDLSNIIDQAEEVLLFIQNTILGNY